MSHNISVSVKGSHVPLAAQGNYNKPEAETEAAVQHVDVRFLNICECALVHDVPVHVLYTPKLFNGKVNK